MWLQFISLPVLHMICFKVKAASFTALVYSVLLSIGSSVLKIMDTLWKNTLIIAKDV
jgi:hypothetical protein